MIGGDHPRAVAAQHFLWFEELECALPFVASCALYRSQVEAYRVL
jgi:hypothetical protein